MKSTENYLIQIDKLKKALEDADVVVTGAGAGLSTSAGFVYSGEPVIVKYPFWQMTAKFSC